MYFSAEPSSSVGTFYSTVKTAHPHTTSSTGLRDLRFCGSVVFSGHVRVHCGHGPPVDHLRQRTCHFGRVPACALDARLRDSGGHGSRSEVLHDQLFHQLPHDDT